MKCNWTDRREVYILNVVHNTVDLHVMWIDMSILDNRVQMGYPPWTIRFIYYKKATYNMATVWLHIMLLHVSISWMLSWGYTQRMGPPRNVVTSPCPSVCTRRQGALSSVSPCRQNGEGMSPPPPPPPPPPPLPPRHRRPPSSQSG